MKGIQMKVHVRRGELHSHRFGVGSPIRLNEEATQESEESGVGDIFAIYRAEYEDNDYEATHEVDSVHEIDFDDRNDLMVTCQATPINTGKHEDKQ